MLRASYKQQQIKQWSRSERESWTCCGQNLYYPAYSTAMMHAGQCIGLQKKAAQLEAHGTLPVSKCHSQAVHHINTRWSLAQLQAGSNP